MSLGWKRFNFFDKEERQGDEVPDSALCSCSSSEQLFFGCSDGQVLVLDKQLHQQTVFAAFQARVLHLKLLQHSGQQILVVLGCDDAAQLGSTSLKVYNITGGVRSSTTPQCLQTIKCFAPKFPEAQVTVLAAQPVKWPQLCFALGLNTGQILLIQGTKDRHTRSLLSAQHASAAAPEITGLSFHGQGEVASLFVVTHAETLLFNLKSSVKSVLDEMGALPGCTTADQDGDLVVGRPEAVYFYSVDGRGPCFVFEGKKGWLAWTRQYLVAVTTKQPEGMPAQHVLQMHDLRNKLIACSLALAQEPRHVLAAGSLVIVVQGDGSIACLKEKALAVKLELLLSKNLHLVALNLAMSEQAEEGTLAEIQRRHGDHLYAKHSYDSAMEQYMATIGHLEPSYVIRRFLDAQRIHNLTSYLEALHTQGRATADHTTLLLNCYTKLKDVTKLEAFLHGSGAASGQLQFDTETAVKVCRGAGYFEQALHVAQAAGQHQWYLDILLEDLSAWDTALTYLQDLPRQEAAAALRKYGKSLVTERPESTTALLMRLCTLGDPAAADGEWTAKVADFAHLYSDRPQALMLLCEFVLNSMRSPPAEEVIYHTLVQLYLEAELADESDTTPEGIAASQASRRDRALDLLKRGWPPGDDPHYDPQHVLVLCRMAGFQAGLLHLYEHLRLFREVLRVHMARDDYAALLDACVRLGDAAKGGDPQLWTEVLEFFGAQSWDCSQQVQEVLQYIEAAALLPPLVVLQALAKNPHLKLSVAKAYIERQLKTANMRIEADKNAIARYQGETATMRTEVQELKTQARVFQNSRCAASGMPLELPAVHFLCGHSYNRGALGDADKECPLCSDQFRHILDIQRSLHASATEQDKFFTQLKSSADGFGVVAEFFGRGLLNASAHTSTAA